MYHQQIAKKNSPNLPSKPIEQKKPPTRSSGSLSGTIQRAIANPETLREKEWLQIGSAIGVREAKEIKSGKRTYWEPDFKGISAQWLSETVQNIAPVQAKLSIGEGGEKSEGSAEREAAGVVPENKTGLPDALKKGIEHLSGYSMDEVKVHYNSDKPATLQAHAYAQGTDIHIAPGQEKHLPHEAWHVVQQMQGRVKATMQANGVAVNDDQALEREADKKGEKALTTYPNENKEKEQERTEDRKGKKATEERNIKRKSERIRKKAEVRRNKISHKERAPIQKVKNYEEVREEARARYARGEKEGVLKLLRETYIPQMNLLYSLDVDEKLNHDINAETELKNVHGVPIIVVRVRKGYLDAQMKEGNDEGYNKLIHTLCHEYKHVQQYEDRLKHTFKPDDEASIARSEFEAYTYEVLDARERHEVPELYGKSLSTTIDKALKYYARMDEEDRKKYSERKKQLNERRTGHESPVKDGGELMPGSTHDPEGNKGRTTDKTLEPKEETTRLAPTILSPEEEQKRQRRAVFEEIEKGREKGKTITEISDACKELHRFHGDTAIKRHLDQLITIGAVKKRERTLLQAAHKRVRGHNMDERFVITRLCEDREDAR